MNISYAQNFEDIMLDRALKQLSQGFYIDIGANDPTHDSVTKLFYENGWSGINIEPLRSHYTDLQRERPRDINLLTAVGSFAGHIELWECDVRGWASADKAVIEKHSLMGHQGKYIKVPVTTLTAICEQYVQQEIHFLKIDVEGFERSVLEGMDFGRFRPWIVVVEATTPNSMEEVYLQWESLLLTVNYRFVYADGINRFYLACEHAQLAVHFKYPPNVFDNFMKVPQTEDNVWAQSILAKAEQIKEEGLLVALKAEALARAAEARAVERCSVENLAVRAQASQVEERAVLLESRVVQAEANANQFEIRVIQAEASAAQLEQRAIQAEANSAKLEQRAIDAEANATQLEQRAIDAEASAIQLEQRAIEAEVNATQLEQRTKEAEEKVINLELLTTQLKTHAIQSRARAIESEAHATQSEARALRASARVTQAELLVIHAQAHATQLEARVNDLLGSISWRVTAPVRLLRNAIMQLKRSVMPAYCTELIATPADISGSSEHQEPAKIAYLSPGEHSIYSILKSSQRGSN